jgi:hypothetical protein
MSDGQAKNSWSTYRFGRRTKRGKRKYIHHTSSTNLQTYIHKK